MATKQKGAPRGNNNAAGPHGGRGARDLSSSSRFRSFATGALFGAVGTGTHAALNTALDKRVRSGYHTAGGATGTMLVGAYSGLKAGGPVGLVGGALLGAGAGALGSYMGSKGGQLVGRYMKKRRG